MNNIYSKFISALTSEWCAFASMMSTAFARTAEITEREITEAEKPVMTDFMLAFVDEIKLTVKQGLAPNANQRPTRGEWFGLKMTVDGSLNTHTHSSAERAPAEVIHTQACTNPDLLRWQVDKKIT